MGSLTSPSHKIPNSQSPIISCLQLEAVQVRNLAAEEAGCRCVSSQHGCRRRQYNWRKEEPAAFSWEILSVLFLGKEGSHHGLATEGKGVGNFITTSDQNFQTLACKASRTHLNNPIMTENTFFKVQVLHYVCSNNKAVSFWILQKNPLCCINGITF